jgi:hypothetical protein
VFIVLDIGKYVKLDQLARNDARKYLKKRFAYNSIKMDKGRHFLGIVGARGIGYR